MRWAFLVVAAAATVIIGAPAAQAENWVQMDPNNAIYYDSDSIFLDAATGYIVYNGATDPEGDGSFNYAAFALDCDGNRVFALGWALENSLYEVDPGWDTDPTRVKPIEAGTYGGLAGQVLCPARSTFRSGTIQ